jgi:hypothetical protein
MRVSFAHQVQQQRDHQHLEHLFTLNASDGHFVLLAPGDANEWEYLE